MQTTQQSTTRNTIVEMASVMRAHPGATDTEICQIGCFTRRQVEQFGKQAAELAGQQSEKRVRGFTAAEIEEAAHQCERAADEYDARATDPTCSNPDHYKRAAAKRRQDAAEIRAAKPASETRN